MKRKAPQVRFAYIIGGILFTSQVLAAIPTLPPFRMPVTLSQSKPVLPPKVSETSEDAAIQVIKDAPDEVILQLSCGQDVPVALWRQGHSVRLYMAKNLPMKETFFNTHLSAQAYSQKTKEGTFIDFQTSLDTKTVLTAYEGGWQLRLGAAQQNDPSSPLQITFMPTALEVALPQASSVHNITDRAGGCYLLVPLTAQQGFEEKQLGPIKFLPTLQGIVMQIQDEGLKVSVTHTAQASANTASTVNTTDLRKNDPLMRIQGHSPLFISSQEDRTNPRLVRAPDPLFTFKDVQEKGLWSDQEQSYVHHLITLKSYQREKARYDLARFYILTDCITEALTMLELMQRENPQLVKEADFMAYKGLVYLLNFQPDLAQDCFALPSLRHEPEIYLWQGVAHLMKEAYAQGLDKVINGLPLIKNYPKHIQKLIAFEGAKAAVVLKYPGDIFLNFLHYQELTAHEKDKYDLFKTALSQEASKLERLTKLSKSKNTQVAIEANLMIVALQPSVTVGDARLLDAMRFSWRGDHTEVKILKLYADTLLKLNQPRQALTIMRQINEYCEGYPEHADNLRQAQNLFFKVFMDDKEGTESEKIALYNTLKELCPSDERQPLIIMNLAKAYESLNLFPQAVKVLKDYVKSMTPQSSYYKQVRIDLARLLIKSEQKSEALDILDTLLALSDLKASERKSAILSKASLLDLSQALPLLQEDDDRDILKLKIDLLWAYKQWDQVVSSLQKMLAHPELDKADKPHYAVMLAVALSYLGQKENLEKLKTFYEESVKKTPYEAAFMMLTSPQVVGKTRYQEALKELSEVKNFDTFLKDFRKKSSEAR